MVKRSEWNWKNWDILWAKWLEKLGQTIQELMVLWQLMMYAWYSFLMLLEQHIFPPIKTNDVWMAGWISKNFDLIKGWTLGCFWFKNYCRNIALIGWSSIAGFDDGKGVVWLKGSGSSLKRRWDPVLPVDRSNRDLPNGLNATWARNNDTYTYLLR